MIKRIAFTFMLSAVCFAQMFQIAAASNTTIQGVQSGTQATYNYYNEGGTGEPTSGSVTATSGMPSARFPNENFKQLVYSISIENDGQSQVFNGDEGIIITVHIDRRANKIYFRGSGVAPNSTFTINDTQGTVGSLGQFAANIPFVAEDGGSINISFNNIRNTKNQISINMPISITVEKTLAAELNVQKEDQADNVEPFDISALCSSGPFPISICDAAALEAIAGNLNINYVAAVKMMAQGVVGASNYLISQMFAITDTVLGTENRQNLAKIQAQATLDYQPSEFTGTVASAGTGKPQIKAEQKKEKLRISGATISQALKGPMEVSNTRVEQYLATSCNPNDHHGNMEVICPVGCKNNPENCYKLTNWPPEKSVDFDANGGEGRQIVVGMSEILTAPLELFSSKTIDKMTPKQSVEFASQLSRQSLAINTVAKQSSQTASVDAAGCDHARAAIAEYRSIDISEVQAMYGDGCSTRQLEESIATMLMDPNTLTDTAGEDAVALARKKETIEAHTREIAYQAEEARKNQMKMLGAIAAMSAERDMQAIISNAQSNASLEKQNVYVSASSENTD